MPYRATLPVRSKRGCGPVSKRQWPFKTTVRYVQEHKTVRIQYAVCADNVAAAKRELLRRFTEQQVNGLKLNTCGCFGPRQRRLNLPDDCVVLPA